jgi:hypothetical protein
MKEFDEYYNDNISMRCDVDVHSNNNVIPATFNLRLVFYINTSNTLQDMFSDKKLCIIHEPMILFDARGTNFSPSASPHCENRSRLFWPLSRQKVSISLLYHKYLLHKFYIFRNTGEIEGFFARRFHDAVIL